MNRGVIRLDPPPNSGGPPVSLPRAFVVGSTLDPLDMEALFWDAGGLTIVQVLSTGSTSEFNGCGAIGIEFQAADGVHYGYPRIRS